MRTTPLILAVVFGVAVVSACDRVQSTLEPDPETIPADSILQLSRVGVLPLTKGGEDEDTIVAKIPLHASKRVVTFTTTAGSFAPTGAQTVDVRAERASDIEDERLVARAVLRSDTAKGSAVVSAKVGDFIGYLTVPFQNPQP